MATAAPRSASGAPQRARATAKATITVQHAKRLTTIRRGPWSVVPGTDALPGLRGEGGFVGQFGKGSEGTLEHRFE